MSNQDKRFPRINRLINPSDYQRVFSAAFRSVDTNFLVLASANGRELARLGMAVSKKQIQLSVYRNKVKRLIRESFRHKKNVLKGWDIVVITKKTICYKDSNALSRSLLNHWKKIAKCEKR